MFVFLFQSMPVPCWLGLGGELSHTRDLVLVPFVNILSSRALVVAASTLGTVGDSRKGFFEVFVPFWSPPSLQRVEGEMLCQVPRYSPASAGTFPLLCSPQPCLD